MSGLGLIRLDDAMAKLREAEKTIRSESFLYQLHQIHINFIILKKKLEF